ncbi:MAG: bacillithiol biosynthesis cysteine-adding enzyme BshC [Capnocytophaga sp.]|nr:bacillithiol biosynthesis cysteine-adding enzyme BshC [Capnocytophaga sp.]
MKTDCIPYGQIRFFSSLMNDYTSENPRLKDLYHRFPTVENFKAQIEEKQSFFNEEKRRVLTHALREQYGQLPVNKAVTANIEALADPHTFTVTTGHQLSLFTGPLYFLYKIISTINTTRQLGKSYPEFRFVPVYWMATEDHDFAEINHFHLHEKKVCWHSEQGGMTGNFDTQTLDVVYERFAQEIGLGKNADYLKQLFKESYLNHSDLASATRYLVNTLFEAHGLVVVDGKHAELKKEFIPYMKEDLARHTAHTEVTQSIQLLQQIDKNYPVQVNPRAINLFYLTPNGRHRIVRQNDAYAVLDTDIRMSETELHALLETSPERFSPNVIMRPLYQEVILPNLSYIGGGGEIAYWLELKQFFKSQQVPFPILMLRNSVMLINQKQYEKCQKMDLPVAQLFLSPTNLKNLKTKELSEFPIDFAPQRTVLQQQFADLYQLATKTDATFENAVKAQEKKQLKGLDMLEKRLLKAQKRKLSQQLQRITDLQSELFPNGSLQERYSNFSEFYTQYGDALIATLIAALNPFDFRFAVIEL